MRRNAKAAATKIDSINIIMEEKKEIAALDANSAADALRDANKAQAKSSEAARKVVKAKFELDEILRIIATVEEPGSSLICMILSINYLNLQSQDFWMT